MLGFFLSQGKKDVDVPVVAIFDEGNKNEPDAGSLLLLGFHALLLEAPFASGNTFEGKQLL